MPAPDALFSRSKPATVTIFCRKVRIGLPLEKVQTILRIYVEGLTGKEVEIAPLSAMPQESRISDGKTIYLPSIVAEFEDGRNGFPALQGSRGARRRTDRIRHLSSATA